MPYFTYDTSVIICRKMLGSPGRTSWLLMSAVVLLELAASASDDSQRKRYELWHQQYLEDDSLLIPNAADWLLAGRILFWLTQRRRKLERGRLSRLQPGASQRMALDVLLAASARRREATIVTENWRDFKAIQHFCNVKVIKASDFFS